MISKDQYVRLIALSIQRAQAIEGVFEAQLKAELDRDQKFEIMREVVTLVGEVLVSHGPKVQNHQKNLLDVYISIMRASLGLTDHPEAPQPDARGPLGGGKEGA